MWTKSTNDIEKINSTQLKRETFLLPTKHSRMLRPPTGQVQMSLSCPHQIGSGLRVHKRGSSLLPKREKERRRRFSELLNNIQRVALRGFREIMCCNTRTSSRFGVALKWPLKAVSYVYYLSATDSTETVCNRPRESVLAPPVGWTWNNSDLRIYYASFLHCVLWIILTM